jgi:hypothetical protein
MKSFMKALSMSLFIAGGTLVLPTLASAGIDIDIGIAPPAPRVEVVPAPRRGYIWAPGYWDYRHRRHVWVPGRWVGERRGYRWVPDRWDRRGPRWHHERGHWER